MTGPPKAILVKNSLLILLYIIISTQNIIGQEQIILSFSSPSKLDSVKIENLYNHNLHIITGNSLIINLEPPTQIESNKTINEIRYYPNPFLQKTTFEIFSNLSGTIHISVFDFAGSKVALRNQRLVPGSNQFVFKPNHPGVYFLNARYNSTVLTAKVICLEGNSAQAAIDYNGSVESHTISQTYLKSAGIEPSAGSEPSGSFFAEIGDLLRFTGYSENRADTKYDFLNTDKNYEFRFRDKYFKFNDIAFQANAPGSVTMLFSVSDSANEGVDYLTGDDFIVSEDSIVKSPGSIFQNLKKSAEIPVLVKNSTFIG